MYIWSYPAILSRVGAGHKVSDKEDKLLNRIMSYSSKVRWSGEKEEDGGKEDKQITDDSKESHNVVNNITLNHLMQTSYNLNEGTVYSSSNMLQQSNKKKRETSVKVVNSNTYDNNMGSLPFNGRYWREVNQKHKKGWKIERKPHITSAKNILNTYDCENSNSMNAKMIFSHLSSPNLYKKPIRSFVHKEISSNQISNDMFNNMNNTVVDINTTTIDMNVSHNNIPHDNHTLSMYLLSHTHDISAKDMSTLFDMMTGRSLDCRSYNLLDSNSNENMPTPFAYAKTFEYGVMDISKRRITRGTCKLVHDNWIELEAGIVVPSMKEVLQCVSGCEVCVVYMKVEGYDGS